ncbi:MAG: sulfatase-like hydrolase/transferase [Deltaproteobacteria bacterium]|nr:sulfatase-like hydrolase/transferase [Deltaproteobacteria bacterium]
MRDHVQTALVPPLLGALLGGTCVGLAESLHILGQAFGTRDYSGIIQAVVLYGAAGLAVGSLLAIGALVLTAVFRVPPDPSRSWTVSWLVVFCGGGFFVARWIGDRDYLAELTAPGRADGLLALGLVLFGAAFYLLCRNALKKTFFSFLLSPLGTGAVFLGLVLFTLLFALGTALNNRAGADVVPRPVAPSLLDRPNLLLIAVEDLDLTAIPEDELERVAPTLARLRRESIRFEEASAHAPTFRESYASLLTSRVPCAHGALGPSGVLNEDLDTLPEVLSRHGYTTGAVLTDLDGSPSFNFGQGYDTLDFMRPKWLLRASESSYRLVLQQVLHDWLRPETVVAQHSDRHYQDAQAVGAQGADWLRRHGAERWFLTLQFSDPGLPLVEHPSVARLAAEPVAQASGGGGVPEADLDALYRAEIAWLDRGIETVVSYMDEHDLLDVTAIAVLGLQGPAYRGGAPLADQRLQVPLFLRLPDADGGSGRRVADAVRLVDVAPTLAELGGAPEGVGWQGISLLREYALREEAQRIVLADHYGPRSRSRALRDGPWKLVSTTDLSGEPSLALYFLDEDPEERENLAHQDAAQWKLDQKVEQLARLEAELCALAGRSVPARVRGGSAMSVEDCEVLRRLGYQEGFSEGCTALDQ